MLLSERLTKRQPFSVMIQLGGLASVEELAQYPSHYHKEMGMSSEWKFAYHILRVIPLDPPLPLLEVQNNIPPMEIQNAAVLELLNNILCRNQIESTGQVVTLSPEAHHQVKIADTAECKETRPKKKQKIKPFIRAVCYRPQHSNRYTFQAFWGNVLPKDRIYYHTEKQFSKHMRILLQEFKKHPNRVFQIEGERNQNLKIQSDEGLAWPFPKYQEEGAHCVRNSLRNIGIDVHCEAFTCFRMTVDKLAAQSGFGFHIKRIRRFDVRTCFQKGLFAFSTSSAHCLSSVDGVFLDTDPRYPYPTRDLASLDIGSIETIYEFTPRTLKKKKKKQKKVVEQK